MDERAVEVPGLDMVLDVVFPLVGELGAQAAVVAALNLVPTHKPEQIIET